MQKVKNYLFVGLLVISSNFSFAQDKVTFLVKQPSLLHSMDQIYIARNFNNCNPADSNYRM